MAYELGGRADKYGNRFEINWTIKKLLDVIEEKIESVTIEALGEDEKGTDLWITYKDGKRESQQCKARNGSQEYWDFGTINSKNIFENWNDHLKSSNEIIVSLVSPLNCTILEDIANRARTNGQKPQLFYDVQIKKSGVKTKNFFDNVCRVLGLDISVEKDLEYALSYFSRVYMRQVTDGEMKEEILSKITNLFIGNAETTYRIFVDYILNEDVYGNNIDISTIGYYLKEQGVEYRNLANDKRIWPAISRLNNEYQQVFKTFSYGFIEREETEKCLELIKEGASIVIHGKAGIGKSGCTENLIDRLKKEKITFAAIKLDRTVPSGNSEYWSQKLGLPTSISYCVNAISPNQRAVILLDQLDALRWTQAHSSDALTICSEIINEIKQINKERENLISLVFVCRTYDLNNDGFISSLFAQEKEWKKVSVGLLKDSEIKKVVGKSFDKLSSRTQNLLRTPSNLYIWEKINKRQSKYDYSATHQLIREWWNQLTYACRSNNLDSAKLESYRDELVKYCYEKSKINMPKILLNLPSDYEEFLVSSGFIIVENSFISFVHQSILDCFFAEEMFKDFYSNKNIIDIAGDKELQTPTKRYQFIIFMQQLADYSEQEFINAGKSLIASEKVRYSFKYIFIEVLSQMPCSNIVKECVQKLIDEPSWKDCVINTIVHGSSTYVHMLRDEGKLAELSKTTEGMNTVINLFHSIKANIDVADVGFIKTCINRDNVREWSWIFTGGIEEDTEALFNLRLDIYGKYPDLMNNIYFSLKKAMQKCEKRTICLLTRMLKAKIHKYDKSIFRNADEYLCDEMNLLVKDYRFVLDSFIPLFPKVTERISFSDWSCKYSVHNGLERICVELVKLASEAFAANEPDVFLDYFKFAYGKGNTLYNEIILDAMFYLDESYADYVLNYISRDSFINAIEDSSNNGNKLLLAKKCISKYSEHATKMSLDILEDRIINYNSCDAKDILRRRREFNEEGKKQNESPVYWPFWGDLQFELIPTIDENRRSKRANDLMRVLSRRFDNYKSSYDYEGDCKTYSVVSPVNGKELSVKIWMNIITNGKISSCNKPKWKHTEGVCIESSLGEFAQAFGSFVSNNPNDVATAMLSLKKEKVNDVFVDAFFRGLSVSNKLDNMSEDILAAVIQKFGYDYESHRAANIADTIEKVEIDKQMDFFVNVLLDIIKKHENPKEGEQVVVSYDDKEGNKVSSIETNAINCVRGRAIKALSSLVWERQDIFVNNKETIERLTKDDNPHIAYATLFLLWPIINYEPEWAKSNIFKMFTKDYRLAGFMDSRRFFCICCNDYSEEILEILAEMFSSDDDRLVQIAAYSIVELSMISDLYPDIYSIYLESNKIQRRSMLEMIITYFENPQYRLKSKDLLEKIILIEDDEDNEYLWGKFFREKLVDAYQDRELIKYILKSKIKKTVLSYFYKYIFEQKMLKEFADEIFDLSHSVLENPDEVKYIWGIDTEVLKMILGLYDETSNSNAKEDVEISLKCLDLWDEMYEKNVGMARDFTEQLLKM